MLIQIVSLNIDGYACACMAHTESRDLRYVLMWQCIDIGIEYHTMILCSMSIEIPKWLYRLGDAYLM